MLKRGRLRGQLFGDEGVISEHKMTLTNAKYDLDKVMSQKQNKISKITDAMYVSKSALSIILRYNTTNKNFVSKGKPL